MTRGTHAGQMEEKMGAPSDRKHSPQLRHGKPRSACISVPVLPPGTTLPHRSTATPDGVAEAPRDNCTEWEYDTNTGKTCHLRPRPAPLNIGNSETTTPAVTSPRARYRVAKAPKPVPYLKPVPSSAARRSEGESRRVRVKFVSSVNRRHSGSSTLSRTQSEKLPPRKELAYLIVDLRSGTPTNQKSKSSEELSEVFKRSPEKDTKKTKPKDMSLSTEPQPQPRVPKPIPRRRTIGGDSCSSPSFINEKESTPPPKESTPPLKESTPPPAIPPKPRKRPTPAPRKPRGFSLPHALGEGASEEQTQEANSPHASAKGSVSLPARLKPVAQKRHKSPSPPLPPHEPDSSTDTMPEPAAECPPEVPARPAQSPPQSPTTVEDIPPPLPEKSALSRQVQRSVKKNRVTPMQSTLSSTEVSEPENDSKEPDTMNIVQNTSYITCLHTSSSHPDLSADTTEPLYTEPLMPEAFSPPSKPKPARPPPPSSGAIQRAKERKEKVLANRQVQATTHSPKKTLHPISRHTIKTTTGHHSTCASTNNTSSTTSNSTHTLPAVHSRNAAPKPPDYEDVDSELDRYQPSPTDPPPKVFRVSQSSLSSPSPPLPPRAPCPSKHNVRRTKQNHVPIPSGFSRQLGEETDNSPVSSVEKSEKEEEEEAGDEELDQPEPVYEPVDTSVPLPPHRSKKKIRGTRTMTMVKRNRGLTNVHMGEHMNRIQKENSKGSKTDPVQRRTLNSSSKQGSKLALVSTSFSSIPRLKGSLSGSLSSEEGGIARVSSVDMERDVGGMDEYVDMQPRTAWEEKEVTEEDDKPEDNYVDMRPGYEGEESEEDQPCGPYAASDLLSCKPELRS